MALSMEEQRILAEIEHNLSRTEPALAARFSRLGSPHPGLSSVLWSPRGRLLAGLAALATLVLMSLVVYLLVSLRGMPQRGVAGNPGGRPAGTQGRVLIAHGPHAHSAPHKPGAHPGSP